MSYCHNCGTQINENNVFCTSCGAKQVSEAAPENNQSGEFNNNTNNDFNFSETQAKVVNSINNFKSGVNTASLADILVKMLIKPVQGAKNFIEGCEKNSVIVLTILLAMVQGILGVWKVNQVLSTITSLAIELVNQVASFAGIFSSGLVSEFNDVEEILDITRGINEIKAYLSIPYGKIFIQNSIMFLVGVLVIFAVISLAIMILNQKKSSAFKIFKGSLIISVPIIYFEAFSIIASYISVYFGIIIFYIGIIVSISCLAIILKEQLEIDKNLSTFVVAISFIASFIILSICFKSFIVSDFKDIVNSINDNMFKTRLF